MSLKLIEKINKKKWWHKLPDDPKGYLKRELFCSWCYDSCGFYGRPLDEPISIYISNPLIGTEEEMVKFLCSSDSYQADLLKFIGNNNLLNYSKGITAERFKLDQFMAYEARKCGYDSIINISKKDVSKINKGGRLIPIEPNILFPALNTDIANYLDGKDEYKPWYDALINSQQIELEVIGGLNATN